jgi:hypothetical protein
MTSLDVSRNRLITFPLKLIQCQSLVKLIAVGNHISQFPQLLFSLRKLEHVDLSKNFITGLPENILFASFRYLSIEDNRIRTHPSTYEASKYRISELRDFDGGYRRPSSTLDVLTELCEVNSLLDLCLMHMVKRYPCGLLKYLMSILHDSPDFLDRETLEVLSVFQPPGNVPSAPSEGHSFSISSSTSHSFSSSPYTFTSSLDPISSKAQELLSSHIHRGKCRFEFCWFMTLPCALRAYLLCCAQKCYRKDCDGILVGYGHRYVMEVVRFSDGELYCVKRQYCCQVEKEIVIHEISYPPLTPQEPIPKGPERSVKERLFPSDRVVNIWTVPKDGGASKAKERERQQNLQWQGPEPQKKPSFFHRLFGDSKQQTQPLDSISPPSVPVRRKLNHNVVNSNQTNPKDEDLVSTSHEQHIPLLPSSHNNPPLLSSPSPTAPPLHTPQIDEQHICKICMEARVDCIALPCGHMGACARCLSHVSECPFCRVWIERIQEVFLP